MRLAASLAVKLSRLLPRMKNLGVEGIVAKRRGSRYEAGIRSTAWLKHRFNEVGEFLIGGYIPEGDTFARLMIGVRRGRDLYFVKKLKNGFARQAKVEIMNAIRGLRVKKCPFVNLPEKAGSRHSAVDEAVMKTVIWVKPLRKVEAEFVEWTKGGRLRHASFRRLV